jgi:AraC-like DNA-binding protein
MASFFNTIILLGIIQGLVVSSLLFFSKKSRYPNRVLAVLILLISLASFNLYGNYVNWFGSPLLRFIVEIIPLVLPMAIGPLVFFYIQSYLEPGFRIRKQHRPHFYPVLIDLAPSLIVIIFIAAVVAKVIKNKPGPWGTFIDNYNVYADIPRWLSITTYLWLSAKYLSAHSEKKESGTDKGQTSYRWLTQFVRAFMIFQAIWLLYLVPYVIPKYTDWVLNTFDWYPVYIPMVILIYWMGIKGYLVSQQIATDKKNTGLLTVLPPALIQQVIDALKKAMEEDKIFLNPGLSLANVSAATGFPQKTISAVLNQHLKKSFNEFVNGYRIQAFTEKIGLPEMSRLTIAGIALECGFNSQATFQRTFKDCTGKSPTEFRKTVFETG